MDRNSLRSKIIIRHIRARPRLSMAIGFGFCLYWFWPHTLDLATRLLLTWNIAVACYLVAIIRVMLTATEAGMRRRAAVTDEGRHVVLSVAAFASVASLVGVVFELFNVKNSHGGYEFFYAGLAVATIMLSWTFIHMMFTEHYAHEYYIERRSGENATGSGLKFPDEIKPDYLDFLYFTFTIGVANQTADISVASRSMRVLVLIHSVISYFFNTIVLALTINIASGLL
jgi:uncharacterized membrane protein